MKINKAYMWQMRQIDKLIAKDGWKLDLIAVGIMLLIIVIELL